MNQKIRIKLRSYDHNLVDKSTEKIVKTVKNSGAANREGSIYGIAFPARKQEISRAVPAKDPQTHNRDFYTNSEDSRCAI